MIFVRLIVRVAILAAVLVASFFILYVIDEQAFSHAYLHLILPGAFLTMLFFIPAVARMKLGKK